MKTSQIQSFVVSPLVAAGRYFRESSWQGKTIQALCALSILYFVVRCLKNVAQKRWATSSKDGTGLTGRVSDPASKSSGQLAAVAYQDKIFVRDLFKQITIPDWGNNIYGSISAWKETERPSESDWIGSVYYANACLKNFSSQGFFQKIYRDPRLQGYDLAPWRRLEQEFQGLEKLGIISSKGCLQFITCLETLQKLDRERQEFLKTALCKEIEQVQQRQFESLQEYIQHLIPNTKDDSDLLGMKRGVLGGRGLVSLQDIDLLHLRQFDHRFITLRQLCCCMRFELQGGEISYDLGQHFDNEIAEFREEIQTMLKSDRAGLPGMQPLLEEMDSILEKVATATFTLETLEKFIVEDLAKLQKKDHEKQIAFLRGYILQQDHAKAWKALFERGIFSLSEYCERNEIFEDPNLLYNIGASLSS